MVVVAVVVAVAVGCGGCGVLMVFDTLSIQDIVFNQFSIQMNRAARINKTKLLKSIL